jgi:hypothetical protein
MPVMLWVILALLVAVVWFWMAARRALPPRPPLPPDVELPSTLLQRASRWNLGLGLLLSACAAGVLIGYGPETVYDNDNVRPVFTFLLLAILITLGAATAWLTARARKDAALLDERDRVILDRAAATQGVAMILTLVVWEVALVEHFHEAGAVPLFYVILIFWSCLVAYSLGLPLGILIGYRKR